ncbi:MAG: hypothetical protein AAGF95_22025 [Chloroflexota bacterium]
MWVDDAGNVLQLNYVEQRAATQVTVDGETFTRPATTIEQLVTFYALDDPTINIVAPI